MAIPIIIIVYILVFLGIIYLSWNYFFNPSNDTVDKDLTTDKTIKNDFDGKKVVFEGDLDVYREESIKNELINKHAILEEKMALDTKFLITGKNPDWLVVEEAKDRGVKIIHEMDWQKTINPIETKLSTKTKLLRNNSKVDSAEIV